jgi:hypothetical protein
VLLRPQIGETMHLPAPLHSEPWSSGESSQPTALSSDPRCNVHLASADYCGVGVLARALFGSIGSSYAEIYASSVRRIPSAIVALMDAGTCPLFSEFWGKSSAWALSQVQIQCPK